MLIITRLHEGLVYVEVFVLNNTVGLEVIRGNLDIFRIKSL